MSKTRELSQLASIVIVNDSNKNVGIGTTNPSSKLSVVGDGNFTGNVTATNFDSLSDINYKKNINTITDALDKVNQLNGVSFEWKQNGNISYGVIAQELQKVLPELVQGDNPKTVNYSGIIGVLIEAVKELSYEIKNLKEIIINKSDS